MNRIKPIKRLHWGEFQDGSDLKKEARLAESKARKKLAHNNQQIISKIIKENASENIITIDNPLVTQTVEVMNQTEMIQGLIDTYEDTTNNSFSRYDMNQVMPNIDLPLDTTADLSKTDKFAKPIWFIPPHDSQFVRGCPQNYPYLSKPVVMEGIRKSLAGMLRLKSFNECTESALVMFTDAVDEFYKCLMDSINQILTSQYNDKNKCLNVVTLEKSYCSLTNSSLTSLHNYYKNEILLRNKCEIKEFKDIFQEYEKLKQESQSIQQNYQIGDDNMTPTSSIYNDGGSNGIGGVASSSGVNMMGYLNTDNASTSGYVQ